MIIKSVLKKFQKETVEWMHLMEKKYEGGMLFSEPGLGKSICNLAVISKDPVNTLIICPAGVIDNWLNEIKKHTDLKESMVCKYHGPGRLFLPTKECFIFVTSYSIASKEDDIVDRFGIERVILDEAHYIRNTKTLAAVNIHKMCSVGGIKKWVVTATPIFNSQIDMFSYFKLLELEGMDNIGTWNKEITPTVDGIEKLNRWVKKYSVSYKKSDVLEDLKCKNEILISLNFNGNEQEFYNALQEYSATRMKNILEKIKKTTNSKIKNLFKNHVMVYLLRLKQACDSPLLILDQMARLKGTKNLCDAIEKLNYYNESKTRQEECPICYDSLADIIADPCGHKFCKSCCDKMLNANIKKCPMCRKKMIKLENINIPISISKIDETVFEYSTKIKKVIDLYKKVIEKGEKIVIVSQWVKMIDLVINALEKEFKELGYVRLQGSVTMKNRTINIKKFQNDPRIKICFISLMSSSEGINLTNANHLVHLDQWWNNSKMLQCSDRIHRIGQEKTVNIYKFQINNTIEEKIEMMASNKENISMMVTGKWDRNTKIKFDEKWLVKQVIKLAKEA